MSQFRAEKHKSLFALEESILEFWRAEKIFEKSLEQSKDNPVFSFYDGPPFITGIPHYGTLLPTIAKDIIPRFQTMKGKYVRRIWGWDVHGLPAENQVEKKLGLKTKKDIEQLGVDKFVEACREYVGEVSDAWRWYIDHIGRWADMDNAYRTDQLSYMESVMSVFKQLYDKDLIYRGRRVSLYCPRCATPLSKFEITMEEGNYRDVEDPAVTVAFRLLNEEIYLLAWTTTPWTLPANLALAIDENAEYVKVSDGHRQFILAHEALPRYQDGSLEVLEYFPGKKLIGEHYEPLYQFFPTSEHDYKILHAGFVTMDDGTGVVHIAPGFGEDDTVLGDQMKLSLHETIDDQGHFVKEVKPWAGQYYKKANPLITEDLRNNQHLFKEEKVTHSYPHCYRCGTPLIYKAQVSWYLRIDPIRDQLLATNKDINWVPKHFGIGRFAHNLKTAPDWGLSRTRYWGSPLPVWETDDGEVFVPGSIAELEKLSGKKITDLHRPFIDEVVLTLPSGKKAKRAKEVLDVWFESASMPYAQDHYPFENKELFEKHFPTDFIIEYTGQLRGWFYCLHVIANALKGSPAFKNVVVTGVLMGSDGRKMSKSFNNYPDPKGTIEKYGAEALRLFFAGSRVLQGEDPAVTEEEIREQSRLLNIFHNSFQYFVTYANLHSWEPSAELIDLQILDRWIIVRAQQLVNEIDGGLESFDFPSATKAIRPFIEDLSTWYIRRNRDRFVAGDAAALFTLHKVLNTASLAMAPILPFSSESIFKNLNPAEQSVHLQSFPVTNIVGVEEEVSLLSTVELIRAICSAGNMLRSQAGISLRQPLARVKLFGFKQLEDAPEYLSIISDELNVKEVEFGPTDEGLLSADVLEGTIGLDIKLTNGLIAEGKLRELMRKLQDARKQAGLQVGEKAAIELFANDELAMLIKQKEKDIMDSGFLSEITILETKPDDLTEIDDQLSYRFKKA